MSFKFKLPVAKSQVKVIEPGIVNPVHEIPAINEEGVERIDLSMFEEWDELTSAQKRYLVEYSKANLKRKRAALATGVNPTDVSVWLSNSEPFRTIFTSINDLHTEAIEEVDYRASFDPKNNTSRGRFLSKRSEIYKEKEPAPRPAPIREQTNILAVLNSDETNSKGLAGVQKMFNALKEQGKLPDSMEVG